MSESKVSVIMPVYNTKEEFLREAVSSILSQTYTNFEFLIIDNGSDEYIKDIINSYNDERIFYHRIEENKGPAFARNYGIDKSRGSYIAFMDSDDISLPTRLEKQVNFLENNPEFGCIGTTAEVFGDDAQKINFNFFKDSFEIEYNLVVIGCSFCQSSVMLRKSVVDKYNIRYRPEWVPAEDYGLYVDLIGKTKFKILDEVLVKYRFYQENTSHLLNKEQSNVSRIVQNYAINKYCNVKTKNPQLVSKFIFEEKLTLDELVELSSVMGKIIEELCKYGCPKDIVLHELKKKVKKYYRHCHSLRGQWNLMISPINKIFNLPFTWRLMCLITRGLF